MPRRLHVPREHFWNVPNTITLVRIGVGPLLLLLLLFPGPQASAVFGIGFLAVSLTDLLDGYLARRDGLVTRAGKLLDPVADKLLVTTALVVLLATQRIPLWGAPLVALILARDIAVSGLRAIASAEGMVLHASSLGKWKMGFQTAAGTALLLHYPWLGLPMHGLGMALLGVAATLSLWSGYDYFAAYMGAQSEER